MMNENDVFLNSFITSIRGNLTSFYSDLLVKFIKERRIRIEEPSKYKKTLARVVGRFANGGHVYRTDCEP